MGYISFMKAATSSKILNTFPTTKVLTTPYLDPDFRKYEKKNGKAFFH